MGIQKNSTLSIYFLLISLLLISNIPETFGISQKPLDFFTFPEKVSQISAGGYSTFILTEEGNVYGWGLTLAESDSKQKKENENSNEQQNTEEHSHKEEESEKRGGLLIWDAKKRNSKVVKIASGVYHFLLLTDQGEVFSWGRKGGLGVNILKKSSEQLYVHQPTKIKSLKPLNIYDIDAGYDMSIALTDKGIYWWGEEENFKISETPHLIPIYNEQPIQFRSICLASQSVFALSENGTIYSCGINSFGQLGHGHTSSLSKLKPISSFLTSSSHPISIQSIACGGDHVLALTNDKDVYSWGSGSNGQLGHGDNNHLSIPKRLSLSLLSNNENKNSVEIKDIFGSHFSHSFLLQNNGVLLGFGWNEDGQLGVGDSDDRLSPSISLSTTSSSSITTTPTSTSTSTSASTSKSSLSIGSRSIVSLSAGLKHTIFLFDDGSISGVGDDSFSQLSFLNTIGIENFFEEEENENRDKKKERELLVVNEINNWYGLIHYTNQSLFDEFNSSPLNLDDNNEIISQDKEFGTLYSHVGESPNFPFRSSMEDRTLIVEDLFKKKESINSKWSLVAIFDGHGGFQVSHFLMNNFAQEMSTQLEQNLESLIEESMRLTDYDEIVERVFQNTYQRLNDRLKETDKFPYTGSTAVTCLIHYRSDEMRVHCANSGDSEAYIIYDKENEKQSERILSSIHRPTENSEVARLTSSPDSEEKAIIINDRLFGMLAVSRSFGDFAFHPYLIVDPSFYHTSFSKTDHLILGSDGLWDSMNIKDCSTILKDKYRNDIGRTLVESAISRGSSDNISVAVIHYHQPQSE